MRLTEDELRAVLVRAEAIQGSSGGLSATDAELESNRPKKAEFAGRTRTGMFIALIGAGLGLGAVLGSIITALLLR